MLLNSRITGRMMITLRSYRDEDYLDLRTTLQEARMFDEVRDNLNNLHTKITTDPSSVIVAAEGDKVVGNVYTMYDGVFAFIFRLAVLESYRKQGVGSLLLEEAEKRLRKKGAASVSVWVRQSELERLEDFYQKRGYVAVDGRHQCMYKEF